MHDAQICVKHITCIQVTLLLDYLQAPIVSTRTQPVKIKLEWRL